MRLVVSVMSAAGVKVAVQTMPPSLELTALKVPLATLRSALVKPVTFSLKVMVTKDVSPIPKAVSATVMVAVGSTPSTSTSVVVGEVNVSAKFLVSASFIVPLLRLIALPTLMPSASKSPLTTV